MPIRQCLLIAVALLAFAATPALAQESEISGGGSSGSGTVGPGTSGTVPVFDSSTTISDSILTQSSGTIAVGGQFTTAGRAAIGSDYGINDSGFWGQPSRTGLSVGVTESGLDGAATEKYLTGSQTSYTLSNSAGFEAWGAFGQYTYLSIGASDAALYDSVIGTQSNVSGRGSGSALFLTSINGTASSGGGFDPGGLVGVEGEAIVAAGATHDVGGMAGLKSGVYINAAVSVTTVRQIEIPNLSNAGTITDETTGLWIGDLSAGTQTNTPYSIYTTDANAPSHFAGYTETPASRLLGGTSGYVAFDAPGAITSYTVSWPAAVAAANGSPLLMSTAGALSFPTGTPDGTKFLTDHGTWDVPSGSGGLSADWVSITNTDSPYTPSATDGIHYILVDASSAAVTINLPVVAAHSSVFYRIKKTDSSANAVILDGDSAETIDGSATFSWSAQNAAYDLGTSGSTGWYIY